MEYMFEVFIILNLLTILLAGVITLISISSMKKLIRGRREEIQRKGDLKRSMQSLSIGLKRTPDVVLYELKIVESVSISLRASNIRVYQSLN